MIDIHEMRRLVSKAYPNETWKERVSGMSDEQVMALYFKFRDNGQLDREPNYYESTRKFRKRGKVIDNTLHNVTKLKLDKDDNVVLTTEQVTFDELMRGFVSDSKSHM